MFKNKMGYKNILIPILIAISLGLFVIFVINIYYKADISVKGICFPEKMPTNIIIGGETTYNNGTTNIKIFVEDKDKKILKHELCHANQFKRKTIYISKNQCQGLGLVGFYLIEIECYTSQNIPNKIFDKIYNVKLSKY